MKLFKDDICFIDAFDLKDAPQFIKVNNYNKDNIAIIKDDESIDYYKNRGDVLDLDYLNNLSSEEIAEKMEQVGLKLRQLFEYIVVNPNENKKNNTNSITFKDSYKFYSKIYKDLVNYKENKEEI